MASAGAERAGPGERAPGVLLLDKPAGLTSHDVVNRVRRLTGERRVGHAGTLDPLATGVLVLCLGSATRIAEYLADLPKVYRATVRLGMTTDTWDAEGRVTGEVDATGVSRGAVEEALGRFEGRIAQVPPMYSALKRDGRPLYRLARKGITVEREARDVEVHEITLEDWRPPEVVFRVRCSKGTYVRALAHELGEQVGVGGTLTALVREGVGHLTIAGAVRLAELESAGAGWVRYLLPAAVALQHLPNVVLDAQAITDVQHGRTVALATPADAGPLCAYDGEGRLIAVMRRAEGEGLWQPAKVLLGAV